MPYCHLWPATSVQYFPTLSQKGHNFFFEGGGCLNTESTMCFDCLYKFETLFILKKIIEWDTIICEHKSSCKTLVILVAFWSNLNSLYRFSKKKNTEIWNVTKIRRTEEAISFFLIFLKAPKRQQNTLFTGRRVTLCNQSTTRFGPSGSLLMSLQY